MSLILIVFLILLLCGTGPWMPYAAAWGYGPSGILGLVLLILVILFLFGRL